jgi:2-dehydro-3-deoxygluconokinase
VERAVDLAREQGLTISLDLNVRRKLWSTAEARPALAGLAARCDVVLGDPDEALIVTGKTEPLDAADLLDALLALGPGLAVLKLGAEGALARAIEGQAVIRPGLAVVPVDPVGAGDAFCAGFIAARLEGADLASALDGGNACGAAAVAAIGDQAGLPDSVELARLLAGSPRDTIR